MQSDLKSIVFCVLFFYKHAENNRIITMEFILKDIMIRTILLVKILKLNEDDDLKSEHKKQELSNKVKKEILRSFLSVFHTRDIKKVGNNIEKERDEIFMSEVGVRFDFSFIVILLKVFKSTHYLKAILHDTKHDPLNQLREELRSSCKKMFEFKESFFDMIKVV
jgi:hypothetical protein